MNPEKAEYLVNLLTIAEKLLSYGDRFMDLRDEVEEAIATIQRDIEEANL